VERFLRDIKTTLQMESLRCKSPALVYRELRMHRIAYQLIRGLLAEAASLYEVSLERISFKGSLDTVRHFSQVLAQARSRPQQTEWVNALLSALAGDPLPDRPNRIEPRHQKRRPKAYPFLIKPRAQLTAQLRRRRNHKNHRS